MNSTRLTACRWIVALVIIGLYLGVGVFDHGVWSPTEPAVSGVVWSMYREGAFAVPRIDGLAYLEKPPLGYWVSWFFCWLSGDLDAGWMRLPSALVGLLGLFILYRSVKRRDGEMIGLLITLLGATTLAFYELAHKSGPDIYALVFIFAAMAQFLNSLGGETTLQASQSSRRQDFFLALTLALSFYGKNFYAAFIVLPAICIHLAQRRAWQRCLRLILLWLVLLVVVLTPWALAVYHQEGSNGLRMVFVDNTIGRFFDLRNSSLGQAEGILNDALVVGKRSSPFFYFRRLVDIILPWTLIMFVGVGWLCFRRRITEENRFLRTAIITIPVLLTLSSSKNGYYLQPIMFPMLLATGTFLRTYFDRAAPWPAALVRALKLNHILLGIVLAVGLLIAASKMGDPRLILLAWIAAAIISWSVYRLMGRYRGAESHVGFAVAVALASMLAIAVAVPMVDPQKANAAFFAQLKPLAAGRPLYTTVVDDRSLPLLTYYLDRRIDTLANLAQGIDRLHADPDAVLIISQREFKERQQELRRLGLRPFGNSAEVEKFILISLR